MGPTHAGKPHAGFRNFEESTQEDWSLIGQHFRSFAGGLADRVLRHLMLLDGDYGGFPIDRLQHSLQTATRAHRDGRGESYVVMALLHDIGDTLGSYNHPDIGAAIVKPFVTEEEHWICAQHGVFQGYYYFHFLGGDRDAREAFRDHPHFAACELFCREYDQAAFDPDYDTEPLDFFEPMLRRVLARPVNGMMARVVTES
ncbi:HD domain-containing protein [Sphingomonas sp.]|uniref:HD domain-containing protein n=1 Tax=Sphingomonas sp. TaxID=28214 RepID=UPI0025FC5D7B|nr:HD domain-containing protein [Sphingomonas sp.]